jgi:hypothetical protein
MRKAYERLSIKVCSYLLHQQLCSLSPTIIMDLSFDNSSFHERFDLLDSLSNQSKSQHFRRFKSDKKRQDALHNARAARIRAGRNSIRHARPSTFCMIVDIPCRDVQIPAYVPLHYHRYESYPVYFNDKSIEIRKDEEECKKAYEELLGRNVDPSIAYAIIEVSYGGASSFVYAPQYFRDSNRYPVYFNHDLINPEEDQKECNEVYNEVLGDHELYGFGE